MQSIKYSMNWVYILIEGNTEQKIHHCAHHKMRGHWDCCPREVPRKQSTSQQYLHRCTWPLYPWCCPAAGTSCTIHCRWQTQLHGAERMCYRGICQSYLWPERRAFIWVISLFRNSWLLMERRMFLVFCLRWILLCIKARAELST